MSSADVGKVVANIVAPLVVGSAQLAVAGAKHDGIAVGAAVVAMPFHIYESAAESAAWKYAERLPYVSGFFSGAMLFRDFVKGGGGVHEMQGWRRMKQRHSRWTRVKEASRLLAGVVVVVAVFAVFGQIERGWAAAMLLVSFPVVIRAQWEWRKEPWYWATLGIIGLATVLVIVLVPWQALQVSNGVLYVVAFTQYTVLFVCPTLVDKVLHGKPR